MSCRMNLKTLTKGLTDSCRVFSVKLLLSVENARRWIKFGLREWSSDVLEMCFEMVEIDGRRQR